MKKDWVNLLATLKQVTKLQPHFINIWSSSVAWDVSYNISVEFDDYRERYRWVMKGIEFLEQGIKYNERQPKLLWDMGWTISEKIGKADEAKEFRKLFKEDDEYHNRFHRPTALRDNWLVGKEWFEKAVDMVSTGVGMMGKGPLIYLSNAPMCQMYYAQALETDGTFGEVAKRAWAGAAKDWKNYSELEIPTSFRRQDRPDEPVMIRLGDLDSEDKTTHDLLAKLDALDPGLRAKLVAEKRAMLTESQRKALDTPLEKRTGKQLQLAAEAAAKVEVTDNEVARKITGPKRKEALELAKKIGDHEQIADYIRRYRNIVNYEYWKKRAQIEQTPDALSARKLIFQGDRAFSEGALVPARDDYTKGLAEWRKVLDANKELVSDQTLGEYLLDVIKRYRRILNKLDDTFPDPFILQDVIDAQQKLYGASSKGN